MNPHPARDVLAFWFGELSDGFADDERRRSWFEADPARDAEIRGRFAPLLARAAAGDLESWRGETRSALALIIVCDQFSRQIHRGTAAAYATDPLALAVAGELVERGADLALELDERAFVYMPFEHAESRVDQHACVGLFSALRDATPSGKRHLTGAFLQHAHRHRDILLRFGRFPHRNAVLGRPSTTDELAFMASAADFGQTAAGSQDRGA